MGQETARQTPRRLPSEPKVGPQLLSVPGALWLWGPPGVEKLRGGGNRQLVSTAGDRVLFTRLPERAPLHLGPCSFWAILSGSYFPRLRPLRLSLVVICFLVRSAAFICGSSSKGVYYSWESAEGFPSMALGSCFPTQAGPGAEFSCGTPSPSPPPGQMAGLLGRSLGWQMPSLGPTLKD